jgi:hypothetical protein
MNTTDVEIKIPAAINALPLTLTEKAVLAHIRNFPGCSNSRLAELIGGSRRGVEKLLRRLRDQGYIEPSGKGRARRHQLMFPVEHHTKCGDGDIVASDVKSHTLCVVQPCNGSGVEPPCKVAVLKREVPLMEDLERTLDYIEEMSLRPDIFPEAILYVYKAILKRVVDEAPASQAKDALVREMTRRKDGFVAICFARRLPKQYHREAVRLIYNATPEKLAELRRRVESSQLDDKSPLMLTVLANHVEVVAS